MEIVRSTASLLANQIENLRLFDQAERYRVEAEESARRLTREGWNLTCGPGIRSLMVMYTI